MRTPYPELLTDTTARLAAFIEWNADVQASIDEYWQHPQSPCPHQGNCNRAARRAKGRGL